MPEFEFRVTIVGSVEAVTYDEAYQLITLEPAKWGDVDIESIEELEDDDEDEDDGPNPFVQVWNERIVDMRQSTISSDQYGTVTDEASKYR